MFKHNCEKCGKGFNKISHLKAHLIKKKPCDKDIKNTTQFIQLPQNPQNSPIFPNPILSNQINPVQINPVNQVNQVINKKIEIDNIQIDSDNESNSSSNIKDAEKLKEKPSHFCIYCKTTFKKKYNLERHINDNRCKVKVSINTTKSKGNIISSNEELNILLKEHEVDEQTKLILNLMFRQNNELIKLNSQLKTDYESLRNDNVELRKEIGNLKQTTINNTLNNQNNIIIAHGNEDLNKIELKTIIEHLATLDFKNIIPNMAKHVYINDSKPEYKNFCVVDLARNKCQYHNGKKWVTGKTNDKIAKIFDNVNTMLTEPFEKDKLLKTIQFIQNNEDFKTKNTWINYSKNYLLSLWDENDKENIENRSEIINELKLVFYNNKNEILKITLDEIN